MPDWLAAFAHINPVTQFANAVRGLTLVPEVTPAVWWSLLWIVALTVVGAYISIRAWVRMGKP